VYHRFIIEKKQKPELSIKNKGRKNEQNTTKLQVF
jgi:hypothetical protein